MAYKQLSPIIVAEGGTGAQTLTDHAVLIGSGTGAITAVGPVASTGALLASNGVGSDPGFTTATYPLTTTVSEILYSSATNTVTGLATANRAVLTTGATGVPALTAIATDGQFIIGSTAGAPAAGTITSTGATITITPGSNTINLETAATSSGAWTLVSAQTASDSADIRFTSLTDQKYMVQIYNTQPATNVGRLLIEGSTDNGSTWAVTGYQSGVNYSAYNTPTVTNSNSTADLRLSGPMGNTSSNQANFVVYLNALNTANPVFCQGTGNWADSGGSNVNNGGWFRGSGPTGINAIRFRMSTGNITGGTYALYSLVTS